ncbi:MAG: FAD-dependent oxidoreductase [Planctomycetes bacterium]|nr:FAD-dependent oxidoreductase [Planctomycetota bacterium]
MRDVRSLTAAPLDVLIIGGGIVGAGVVRDAAMRGLSVGLVEQYDFASGTSSRSSRLLHGGLRYLAQGRIGLVREAAREKRIVHHIAPHLAPPLAFIFPTRRGTPWRKSKLWLGVKVYDWLGGRNFEKSRALDVSATLDLLPGLDTRNLTGSVRYFDAQTHDARLVIDSLRSAAKHGGIVTNYIKLVDAQREEDLWRCTLEDRIAGDRLDVKARCIVNAAGPWSDRLPHSHTRLRLTKGAHLVIDRERLPIPDAVVMTQASRILFAIPWGQRVILGTTDTDYEGPPEAPVCDEADRAYILDVVNTHFPEARIGAEDVISTWAGLRPLVWNRKGRPSELSRSHEIKMSEPGWIDVTGGKLTTYRLMAEQTVDLIARRMGRKLRICRTAAEPLLETGEVEGVSGVVPPAVQRAVVEHAVEREWAVNLDDVMTRRTGWRHYHADHASIARQAADWMAQALSWDARRRSAEVARYLAAAAEGV